eukprot:s340_g6.t3
MKSDDVLPLLVFGLQSPRINLPSLKRHLWHSGGQRLLLGHLAFQCPLLHFWLAVNNLRADVVLLAGAGRASAFLISGWRTTRTRSRSCSRRAACRSLEGSGISNGDGIGRSSRRSSSLPIWSMPRTSPSPPSAGACQLSSRGSRGASSALSASPEDELLLPWVMIYSSVATGRPWH